MIRAAFDIGSGATKIQVATVDAKEGRILEVLFSKEVEILIGIECEKNDGTIDVNVENFLLQTLQYLKTKAEELGAKQYAAVATEVFRRAKNGQCVLDKIKDTIGILPQLVSQESEGVLGFLTAAAVSAKNRQNVISWDSGGASFQIVTFVDDKIQVYEGPLGSGNTTRLLIEKITNKSFKQIASPNPVQYEDAQNLIKLIESIIRESPSWLSTKLQEKTNTVVAIGGDSCCFTLATQILKKSVLYKEDIQQAIAVTSNKTDEQLSDYIQKELVVPKLCLILAVMYKLNIQKFEVFYANGITPGLLIANQFW